MKRLYIFLRYFFTLIFVSVLGRMMFVIINGKGQDIGAGDVFDVFCHGLGLDSCIAGYLSVLPLMFFAFMKSKDMFIKTYNAVVALIMSTAIVADAFLYGFWGFKLDVTVLNYIDSPNQAFASVSAGYIVLRSVIIAVIAAVTYIVLPHKSVKEKVNPWMLLLCAPMFVVIRGGVSESTANVGKAYFSDRQFLNHAAVPPVFSFMASINKTEHFSEQFNFFNESERQRLYASLYAGNKTGHHRKEALNTTRPNVLIVIMEGFGTNMLEYSTPKSKVAPNLTAISGGGMYFSHCYANSFRTDRGVVSILSAFPGQPTTSVMKMADRCGNLPSIAKSLKTNGYTTEFIYGGDINFTNMKGYLLSTGYSKLIAKEDFTLSEQRSNAWGAQDEYTAERVIGEVAEKSRQHQPWLITYLTLSSHEPFEVPESLIKDDAVLNSFAYTDKCIGNLISKLQTTDAWRNLLVILLPDHGIRGVKALGNTDHHSPDFYHIPMIWTGGAVKSDMQGSRIDCIMSQTDLAATLLGQMDIRYDDFEFSRDVLSDGYSYPFAFSCFNNGFVFRDSTGATVFDNDAGKSIIDVPSPSSVRLTHGQVLLQTLYDRLETLRESF